MSKSASSFDRVLQVLDLFSEDRLEWTPEELMAALGFSRPTLYRYLKTLRDAGFLTSLPNAGLTLGPRVVEMDYLLRKSDPLILSGEDHLDTLTKNYPCTAFLVRWYGEKILCVSSVSSSPNPLSSYPRGRPMPLGRGAIARSILAYLPRRRSIPLIEHNFDELSSVGLGQTIEAIYEGLKKVRKAGFAVAHGEVTPGVVGIAAPVFDAGQTPIASLCVIAAGHLVRGQDIETISQNVRKATAGISAQLSERRTF